MFHRFQLNTGDSAVWTSILFCMHPELGWSRTSMGKTSTCPLCKESFLMIKKVEHAATAYQKIYPQSIPCGNSASDVFVPMNQELSDNIFESSLAGACVVCCGHEPEDLLECCDVCHSWKIHSYCMDPPLRPWTCSYCRELRMLYRSNHSTFDPYTQQIRPCTQQAAWNYLKER